MEEKMSNVNIKLANIKRRFDELKERSQQLDNDIQNFKEANIEKGDRIANNLKAFIKSIKTQVMEFESQMADITKV
jgi:gas vesicle protein